MPSSVPGATRRKKQQSQVEKVEKPRDRFLPNPFNYLEWDSNPRDGPAVHIELVSVVASEVYVAEQREHDAQAHFLNY